MKYKYIKLWNSQENLDELFNKLSDKQKKKLVKIIAALYLSIDSFKENKDTVYSLVLHHLNDKVQIVEKEVTVKKLVAVQSKPYEQPIHVNGPIEWISTTSVDVNTKEQNVIGK